jgi:hypothetical protein
MGGYLISLDSLDTLELYIKNGFYGTKIKYPKNGQWSPAHEYTLADYCSMKEGEFIFFFIKRIIYGVGKIVSLNKELTTKPVALCNYPKSYFAGERGKNKALLWNENVPADYDIRWVVFYKPAPHFFKKGLDMDEVLMSDRSNMVRSLRTFQGLSFIKMDTIECNFILQLLIRKNLDCWDNPDENDIFYSAPENYHQYINKSYNLAEYQIDVDELISKFIQDDKIKHEAILQTWLVSKLTHDPTSVSNIFSGPWNYIANQVSASPYKPITYMDKIDIFGIKEKPVYPFASPIASEYLIIEVKKDFITSVENMEINPIGQLMKYVDWVAANTAGGDYNLIKAYLIANGFSQNIINLTKEIGKRQFVLPRRPYLSGLWQNIHLVSYIINNKSIQLEKIL